MYVCMYVPILCMVASGDVREATGFQQQLQQHMATPTTAAAAAQPIAENNTH